MFKNNHLNVSLFDFKINSPHKDLILVKGNESECDPIPFEGSVKLSISQDMHVKKINLILTGEFNIEFFERMPSGMISDQIYEKLCVLRVEWNNLLTDDEGEIKFGNYGEKFVKMSKLHKKSHSKPSEKGHNHSSSLSNIQHEEEANDRVVGSNSLERPSYLRTKSTPLLNKNASSNSLVQVPKSGIDGTPFKLQKSSSNSSYLLPKGNYRLPFKCYLPANTPETVDGLKCCQLLYKLECNIERGRFEKSFHKAKHIRIHRTLHPQSLNLTDSIDINNNWPNKVQYNVSINRRGISLGSSVPVNLLIIPIAKGLKLKGINGALVQHYHTSHTEGRSPELEEIIGKQSMFIPNPDTLPADRWVVKSHFKVPSTLNDLTQTCDLKDNIIQVRHRLRIAVQLKNKEGHVSELRANLPVFVYISPTSGTVIGRHYEITAPGYMVPNNAQQDNLFRKERKSESTTSSSPQSPELAPTDNAEDDEEDDDHDNDLNESAPPLYEQHVFDKIFDVLSPQSPLEQLRKQTDSTSPFNSLPTSMVNITSYFDIPRNNASQIHFPIESPNFDVTSLSKVPSYTQAIDDDDEENELAPTYIDDFSVTPYASPAIPIPLITESKLYSKLPSPMAQKSPFLSLNKSHRRSPSHSPHSTSPSPSMVNLNLQSTSVPSKSSPNFKLGSKLLHKKKK